MAEVVRIPSSTPNILVEDDCRMFRYGVGGYNGYIPKYKNEIGYEINANSFTVQSGEIVADGYQVDISDLGESITTIASSNMYYYTVYLELDLRISTSPTARVLAQYSLTGYPTIMIGDDLTSFSSGIKRIELYRFTVTNSVISNVNKIVEEIPYLRDIEFTLKEDIAQFKLDTNSSLDALDERLKRLGFREGSVTLSSGTATTNKITRQGNYVIGTVIVDNARLEDSYPVFFTLPNMFRPLTSFSTKMYVNVYDSTEVSNSTEVYTIKFNSDGTVVSTTNNRYGRITKYEINFGFEAPPIV